MYHSVKILLLVTLVLPVIVVDKQMEQATNIIRVVDINGQPVAGAEILVYERLADYAKEYETVEILGKPLITSSQGEAHLILNNLNGRWLMIVACKNNLALGWDIPGNNPAYPYKGNINIILDQPCQLSGSIVDETGQPLVGARVQAIATTPYLSRLEQNNPLVGPEDWLTQLTDAAGHFYFDIFSADTQVSFWVKAPGRHLEYKFSPHRLASVGYVPGQNDVRLVMPPVHSINGRVIDAHNGDGLEGIPLFIRPAGLENKIDYEPFHVISGPDGQFYFPEVPTGTQYLKYNNPPSSSMQWLDKSIKVDVSADKETKNVLFALNQGSILDITVRDGKTNQPLADAYVRITNDPGNFSKSVRTSMNGQVLLSAPIGESNIQIVRNDYSQFFYDTVKVSPGKTNQLDVTLDIIPEITGIVLDEYNQPVADAKVAIYPSIQEVISDSTGKFNIPLNDRGNKLYLFARAENRNLATAIEVKDEFFPLKIQLQPGNILKGKVTDVKGGAIPAARVTLYNVIDNSLSQVNEELLTDTFGHYEFKAIPIAQDSFEYRISAHAIGYGPKEFKRILIQDISNQTMELEPVALLRADQSIAGVLVDLEGNSIPGEVIHVRGDNQPHRNGFTNEKGNFVINRLTASPLRLQAGLGGTGIEPGFLNAQGGDVDLKIVMGQRRVHVPQVTLLNKSLPDMKEIGKENNALLAENKALLICFFDMNQRPSRYCLTELAKEIELLTAKGVSLVAVQASKVENNIFQEWVNTNNIPFTIGIIKGDEEKTKFNWGVQALPWLILTDKQHLVRAEGFGVDEVEEKIKEIIR